MAMSHTWTIPVFNLKPEKGFYATDLSSILENLRNSTIYDYLIHLEIQFSNPFGIIFCSF